MNFTAYRYDEKDGSVTLLLNEIDFIENAPTEEEAKLALAVEHDYEVLTLVLRGNVDVLHQRYLHRMQNENRHPVHLSTTLDIFEDFKAYTEHSRQEEIPGNVLEINADDFSYQTDGAILAKIDNFMERRQPSPWY